jgi:adenine-specific DNA-methyltransferase
MGEQNFVATCIWRKNFSPKPGAKYFSEDHDYLLVATKDKANWRPNLLERTEAMDGRFENPDSDPRGPWTSGDLSARNPYSEGTYAITCPSGRVIDGPPPGTYWRISKSKFDALDSDKRIWWGDGGNNQPRLKRFLSEVKAGRVPQTLWDYTEVGHTQDAKRTLLEMGLIRTQEDGSMTPKPTARSRLSPGSWRRTGRPHPRLLRRLRHHRPCRAEGQRQGRRATAASSWWKARTTPTA